MQAPATTPEYSIYFSANIFCCLRVSMTAMLNSFRAPSFGGGKCYSVFMLTAHFTNPSSIFCNYRAHSLARDVFRYRSDLIPNLASVAQQCPDIPS